MGSRIHLDKDGENVVIKVTADDEEDFAIMMVALLHSAYKAGAGPRIKELLGKSSAGPAVEFDSNTDSGLLH